jgi:hypothetical protein
MGRINDDPSGDVVTGDPSEEAGRTLRGVKTEIAEATGIGVVTAS